MNEEIKRLQKEINGTVVNFSDGLENGVWSEVEALCLIPPNGSKLSIKPYGYTPEQLVTLSKGQRSINHVSDSSFCFVTISNDEELYKSQKVDMLLVFKTVASMVNNGEINLKELQDLFNSQGNGSASCPYG